MEEQRGGYRILVADDDANVHQSLNAYFRREGYQMISAYDGNEALACARKSRPDMIILKLTIHIVPMPLAMRYLLTTAFSPQSAAPASAAVTPMIILPVLLSAPLLSITSRILPSPL